MCTQPFSLQSLCLSGRLPAACMSSGQSTASWQCSTNLSASFFRTFPTTTALCLCVSCLDAVVHFVNMTAFTRGGLHSSFWIVDRKHIYIGSADMDWRSLSKVTARSISMSMQAEESRENQVWSGGSFLESKWLQLLLVS